MELARPGYKKSLAWRRRFWIEEVLRHYSGDPPRCQCPGCPLPMDNILFLEIDHIDGLSPEEKEYRRIHKQRSHVGYRMAAHLIRNNYPSGYQILCSNCNRGRSRNGGVCPHLDNKLSEAA